MRSEQRLELNGNLFHCFNEVDTLKELSSDTLVSFFKELDTRQGTLVRLDPVSFFKELDTGKRTVLRLACFIFQGA